jgi:hypothetical protein
MFNNVEDLFNELNGDGDDEYKAIAETLAHLRDSLISNGFNRREAMRLVDNFASFVYELAADSIRIQKFHDPDTDE